MLFCIIKKTNHQKAMKPALNLIISGTLFGSFATNVYAAAQSRPNVIVITTDQQFAEAMSCRMGDRYINTPAMDRLAANGITFTRAYSPNPLSEPARNCIITGRYAHETGVTWNITPKGGLNSKEFVSMGTWFRNSGYETAYFGKWHLEYNIKDPGEHGFDVVKEQGRNISPDTFAADEAVKFLSGSHNKPFLLFVSFLNPHNICEWARRASGMKQVLNCGEIGDPPSADKLPPAPVNLDPPVNEPDGLAYMRKIMQVDGGVFPVSKFTAEDWQRQRWGYYRMIELVDREIGRVMEALHKAGIEENTLVVFTSDHGELAGAHRFNQKTVFYEESVRVPLIISMKGKTKAGTSDKLVNTGLDILPTLMDCAGIKKPFSLTGISLWPTAQGKGTGKWRDHIIVENDLRAWQVIDTPRMEGRMVVTERYKYCIYSKGTRRESLVDLKNDPGETMNVADDPAYRKILENHREILRNFGIRYNDPLVPKLLNNNVAPIPFTELTRKDHAEFAESAEFR
jgi:arylsulfatase A-like enzyme